jgi:protein-tyrosine kinase
MEEIMASKRQYELITHEQPKSPVSEAYRTLRTNLGFTNMDQDCRCILISSPNPQDGKSTTASNLAVVLAQAGNNVLLVDCDLRKPVQHKIFGIPNQKGLTNCLLQKLPVEEVAYNGKVDNLSVLPSGPIPPNPAEILNSNQTRRFWQVLLESYDYVLIDGPPILAVADSSILSNQVDGVILVIRSNITRIDLAKEAKEQLLKANARLIGVVINDFDITSKYYQYYYYYGTVDD